MPTPSFFESRAPSLWPHRWAFGIATVAVFLAFFGLLLGSAHSGIERPIPPEPLFTALSTTICWLWGLLLTGVWFHPDRGTARIGSPWFLRAPRVAQVCSRWYAAIFLALWFAVPFVFAALLAVRWAAA